MWFNQRKFEYHTERYSQVTGISLSTVKRTIKKMSDDGIIERKGGKRYGYGEIHQ